MQDNQRADSLINRAFQALLVHRQTTYLVVDRQNHLLHICGDCLSLIATQTELTIGKDIVHLLPTSLRLPVKTSLQQAKKHGDAKHSGQVTRTDSHAYSVTIEACLHPANQTTEEFLTILIEREPGDGPFVTETTELIEVNKRLRAEILDRQQAEQQLAQKAEALAHSNADLEEFAYVVSHDLQEPLRAMTAFSQLLSQRYGQHLDTSAKRYIKHIVDGGTRMKAMIDGILELSRINSTQWNNTLTDLEQALKIALENLKLIRLETHATVTHNALPGLYIDKNHIVQLLQNLISNAIKFRGSAPPHIHITAEPQSRGWLFSVHDNGIGIPQDQQNRIFKLFQRLHNQQEQKGYGIGLAICKKIVEHYQGEIWLKSSPGEGSTFYFTLLIDAYQDET